MFDFNGKSRVVYSFTGISKELTASGDGAILSRREKQVLTLIAFGKSIYEIAVILSISKNTVRRHHQQILAKLQVKNSIEAAVVDEY